MTKIVGLRVRHGAAPHDLKDEHKPKFTRHRHCLRDTGIAPAALFDESRNSRAGATTLLEGAPAWRVRANCRKPNVERIVGLGR